MKKSANSNMYEAAADFAWQTFGVHFSGCRTGLWCVVSEQTLDDKARAALKSSAAALGYGGDACTFVTLTAEGGKTAEPGGTAGESATASAGESGGAGGEAVGSSPHAAPCPRRSHVGHLRGHGLFTAVESIDPLCVVATDSAATQALATAYRQDMPLDQSCRLFGRDSVAFRAFESLLTNPERKQKAWALLKKLPRFDQT